MSTPASRPDITAGPRAILRESVRILTLVLGEERVGDARRNAWDAIRADRAAAATREELSRMRQASRR